MRNRSNFIADAKAKLIETTAPVDIHNIPLDIKSSDKVRLEYFAKQETNYYNKLVEGFSSVVRTFPEIVMNCRDEFQKIFGYVAETREDMRKYIDPKRLNKTLPPLLELYRSTVQSLSERNIILTDVAAAPGLILPIVRRNMAVEFLKFYQEQAAKILTPAANRGNDQGNLYREPPQMLEPVDYPRKRHLQIPKHGIRLEWNAAEDRTELRVGYVVHPISVPHTNLLVKSNWNFAIIRQETFDANSQWLLDVRKLPVGYLIKNFDSRNNSRRH